MELLTDLSSLVLLGFLIERIINLIMSVFKNASIIEESPVSIPLILSLILGIGIGYVGKIDIFASLGLNIELGSLAYILTGIILSGGSNMIADIINFKKTEKEYIESDHTEV